MQLFGLDYKSITEGVEDEYRKLIAMLEYIYRAITM